MDGYGSHHHHHHGSNRYGSRDHESRRQEEYLAEVAVSSVVDPSDQNTTVHHFYHGNPNPFTGAIERANYEEDRGDYYKAAYKQQRQRADIYHAERDEYGERYHEEYHRRRSDYRRARQAQHDHWLQGYADGCADSYEYSDQAMEDQYRQHQQARQEDQRRYNQNVHNAYAYGHMQGEQKSGRSKKKTPRQSSPSNHNRRITYQDSQGNDAAFTDGSQWHGYAETEDGD